MHTGMLIAHRHYNNYDNPVGQLTSIDDDYLYDNDHNHDKMMMMFDQVLRGGRRGLLGDPRQLAVPQKHRLA